MTLASEPSEPQRRRFEHVLVATDFSAGAVQALERAGRLPLANGARFSIVHVLPDGLPQATRARVEQDAHRQLERAAATLSKACMSSGREDVAIASALCCAKAAFLEIIRHAKSVGVDLVVLGRHGRRPVKDMFIGSTAERVIRTDDFPVLVVSRKAVHPYRRPLLAVDLEDTSQSMIELALRILGPEAAAAAVVHAYAVPFEGFISPYVPPGEMTEFRQEYRDVAVKSLARLLSRLGDAGMRWETAILQGDPRSVILTEAQRWQADLLVVGTHGRTGLAHALLGSVAEWVMQAAPCDLLIARSAQVSL